MQGFVEASGCAFIRIPSLCGLSYLRPLLVEPGS